MTGPRIVASFPRRRNREEQTLNNLLGGQIPPAPAVPLLRPERNAAPRGGRRKNGFKRCLICDSMFHATRVDYWHHIQGRKHKAKRECLRIISTLKRARTDYFNEETKELKCTVCNVTANSALQLKDHLKGNRHKKRFLRAGGDESKLALFN